MFIVYLADDYMKCKALFFYKKYSEIKMSSAAVAISTLSLPLLIYSVRTGFDNASARHLPSQRTVVA